MNFTASQKKWALTASLATVLSFNLVMSLGYNEFGAANLSSNGNTLTDSEMDRFEELKEADKNRAQKAADDAEKARLAKNARSRGDNPFKMRDVEINDQKEEVLLVKEGNKTRAIISRPTEAEGTCSECLSRLVPVAFDADIEDITKALKKS
ncbi:MAG: hypothetical protein EOP09_20265, partial [Proteobacteria bacterium]